MLLGPGSQGPAVCPQEWLQLAGRGFWGLRGSLSAEQSPAWAQPWGEGLPWHTLQNLMCPDTSQLPFNPGNPGSLSVAPASRGPASREPRVMRVTVT